MLCMSVTLLLIHLYSSDDVESAFIQLGIECYVRSAVSNGTACCVIRSTATKPFHQPGFFLERKVARQLAELKKKTQNLSKCI